MDRIADAVIGLNAWPRAGAAIAAGALSALALAPFNAFPILWLTLPAFVWLVDGAVTAAADRMPRRFRAGAVAGWCFGLGYFAGGLWWIGAAFLVDGDQFAWLMPAAVLALPAGLALFWALGAGLAAAFWRPGWPRILVLSACMAAVEWLRGHALTGFPWNAFGYVLTPVPLMMQSAALVGLWGLTLAAFVIFAAPAAVVPRVAGRSRGGRVVAAVAAGLFVLHLGYGAGRLALAGAAAPGPSVRIVQPDLEQSEKWQAVNEDEIVARYLRLSADGGSVSAPLDGTAILVWPESAFPFVLSDRPDVLAAIADLLPPGTTLITGAVRSDDPADPTAEAFNSVLVIDDEGTIVAAYDKVHLVPFGEYLPFRALFEAFGIRQMIAIPEGFTPGHARMILSVEGAASFLPLICYEIIFPGAAVPGGPRPGWILNLTNDAWFGTTPGPYQHFLQGKIRAVEEGLPLVRAANSGISAIVDRFGRESERLDLDVMGTVDGNIPSAATLTFYSQFGDMPFLCFLVASAAIAAFAGNVRRVHHN